MKKKKLGCDVDGVLLDFIGYLLPFANDRLGTSVCYDQLHSFDPAVCFNLSSDDFRDLHDQFHAEVYDHDKTPVFDEALESLGRLNGAYEIEFITAAQDHLVEVRTNFLQGLFPGSGVHFTNGHATILGTSSDRVSKFEKALELGVDYMIDDNPHEIDSWDTSRVPLICFPQPWNAEVATRHPHVPRLGWPEIERLLFSAAGADGEDARRSMVDTRTRREFLKGIGSVVATVLGSGLVLGTISLAGCGGGGTGGSVRSTVLTRAIAEHGAGNVIEDPEISEHFIRVGPFERNEQAGIGLIFKVNGICPGDDRNPNPDYRTAPNFDVGSQDHVTWEESPIR